jgi:hypothetical protein
MIVKVYDASTDKTKEFQGTTDQLILQLDTYYTWLKRYQPNGLKEMIKHLRNHQMYFVTVEE